MVKKAPPRKSSAAPNAAVHRAIWNLRWSWPRVAGGALLAGLLSGALLCLRPWVSKIWTEVVFWWLRAMELPGQLMPPNDTPQSIVTLPLPSIAMNLPAQDVGSLFWHLAAVVLLWVAAGWLRDAAKPIGFAMRLAALVHGVAVLFFLFWSGSFTHTLGDHVESGLAQIWYLMLLTPWVHFVTYYLFPVGYLSRFSLSLMTIAYLLVLAPNLYALHIALVMHLGMVMMPVLSLLFGVLLAVVGYVALYGWGMSWPAVIRRRHDAT